MAQLNSLLVTGDSRFLNPINGNARNGVYTVIGTQVASTGSWTGVLPIPALYDGLKIAYYLPYNGSGNATLNLTLSNGTTTGAINCYYRGNSRLTTHYGAGDTIMLTYFSAGSIKISGAATSDNRWIAGQNYTDGNTNTWRNIKVAGTEKLGTATSTGAVDFVNGTNSTVAFNATGSTIAYSVTTTDTYSSTGTVPTTGKAVAAALGTLDGSITGSAGAAKTLTAFSQTDGKVTATFGDIAIANTQVSGLGTASTKDVPASGNASTTQVVLGSDTRLSNARTPTSHTHGNIQNGGTLQTNDITIASGDKIVVTDSSDSSKVARTSISFDGSTATKALTQKGTWETFGTSNLTLGTTATTALKGDTKYAGSSSAGGSATSAVKLDTATAGSATQPCYFTGGKPSACTYSLEASVPANAVFTDTTVIQRLSSSNENYPILMSYGDTSDTDTDVTKICYRNNSVYINPSTGNIQATQLNGVTIGSSPKFTDTNNAVTQTATSTNANYEVLFSSTADNTTRTEGARKNSNLRFNPSTGALQANKLQGIDSSGKVRVEFYNDAENRGRFYLYNSSQSSQIEMVGDGAVNLKNASGTANIVLNGNTGNISCTTVNNVSIPSDVLQRGTFVPNTTTYSADDMRGQTRFLYYTHGVPYTGTTVSFDSSNNLNYSLQLNANYGASTGNARFSFRTRNGDKNAWSNWLECCPVHRFLPRLEANTNRTLYVPMEMRNGTNGDCFFLVASNNYGNSGLYFLTPNTAVAHQMIITTIKASSYLTIAAVSDDWGFKVTAGSAAYYLTIIRLS